MDQLHANPVPLPLGRIVVERHLGVVQRVGEHEWAEYRYVFGSRLGAAPFGPVEQFRIRRLEPVPHLLDRIDLEPERVGQRLLGEPRADPDPKRTGRQLEQGEPAGRVEMVEHRGKHAGRLHPACTPQLLDRAADAEGAVVELGLALRQRP